jgi:predicted TIM-barrel fold metal-dependent hydrolase
MTSMPMPESQPIVDLMFGFPILDHAKMYDFIRKQTKDKESKESTFPVEYMFKGVPYEWGKGRDPLEVTVETMDQFGIRCVPTDPQQELGRRALTEQPKRFFPVLHVDPNQGMEAVRLVTRMHGEFGIKALSTFPAGLNPQVAINDAKFYPLYAKACELDIAYFVNAGVPGPRVPMHCQHVEHLDEVCWFFPELRIVTFHGCEPWEALAVKLMLKWPGLHYATSAFAPKHYPKAIIDYANSRGADKIIYAGYHPMGLSIGRIMTEMKAVPFRDHVWPKFLFENAKRVLKLDL